MPRYHKTWYYEYINPFLCQGDFPKVQEKGLTRLKAKMNHFKFFPFHVIFKSQTAINKPTNSSDKENKASGITINWFLKNINDTQLIEKLPARPEDWVQDIPMPSQEDFEEYLENKHPLFAEIVNLAKQLRLQNLTEGEMMDVVLHRKVEHIQILEKFGICSMNQVKPYFQRETLKKFFYSRVNIYP